MVDHPAFFDMVSGAALSIKLSIAPQEASSDALSYAAAELAVQWANITMASPHRGAASSSLPKRPSAIASTAVSAALLIACRASAIFLNSAGLKEKPNKDGTPVGLMMEGLTPVSRSDGLAIAAARMAARAVWNRVPR